MIVYWKVKSKKKGETVFYITLYISSLTTITIGNWNIYPNRDKGFKDKKFENVVVKRNKYFSKKDSLVNVYMNLYKNFLSLQRTVCVYREYLNDQSTVTTVERLLSNLTNSFFGICRIVVHKYAYNYFNFKTITL